MTRSSTTPARAAVFVAGLVACAAASAAVPYCAPGFVWREAFSGDTVCVVPSRRAEVLGQNRLAGQRVQPGGGPYGPDTCRRGYVWREARPADHVCVEPAKRALTLRENAAAASPQVRALERRLQQRKDDLARAKAARDKAEQDLRRRNEAARHDGLGQTSQPMSVDNVTPIERDIASLEQQLANAKQAQEPPKDATARGSK